MCDALETLHARVHGRPADQTYHAVLQFLSQNSYQFSPCIWQAVAGSYSDAVESIKTGFSSSWPEFVEAWDRVHQSIKLGCCNTQRTHGRWMITQTPPDGPWGGRGICAPTLDPQSRVRRSYASQGECQMALQLLYPQDEEVPVTSTVVCGQMGCDQEVSWAPRPVRQ